jgi:Skp family chaperone for outer membrane proteins
VLKVKKTRVLAVLGVALFLVSAVAAGALAQQGAAAGGTQAGNAIALIDIGVVFKGHNLFKQRMTDLQGDMERAEGAMKKEADQLKALRQKLDNYRAGTPDYNELEARLAKDSADLNVRYQLQKKEFAKAEAKIYYSVYQEIQQEVNAFAQANGIAAVLKFSSEASDPEKPDEVLRDLNKPVIWWSRNLDITPVILETLNRRSAQIGTRPNNGPTSLPQR